MSVTYSFESMNELADFFAMLGGQKRDQMETAKKERDKRDLAFEATTYEYVVDVIRASNLYNATFILTGGELEEAKAELERARRACFEASNELISMAESIDLLAKGLELE